jgi:hypothetical protein
VTAPLVGDDEQEPYLAELSDPLISNSADLVYIGGMIGRGYVTVITDDFEDAVMELVKHHWPPCHDVPTLTLECKCINVNEWGDLDPTGYMWTLRSPDGDLFIHREYIRRRRKLGGLI